MPFTNLYTSVEKQHIHIIQLAGKVMSIGLIGVGLYMVILAQQTSSGSADICAYFLTPLPTRH